jgi:hypothetical protein
MVTSISDSLFCYRTHISTQPSSTVTGETRATSLFEHINIDLWDSAPTMSFNDKLYVLIRRAGYSGHTSRLTSSPTSRKLALISKHIRRNQASRGVTPRRSTHHIEALLDRFVLPVYNSCETTLSSGFWPIPTVYAQLLAVRAHPSAEIVGSILCASTIARPDLAVAAPSITLFHQQV